LYTISSETVAISGEVYFLPGVPEQDPVKKTVKKINWKSLKIK
jgi:hypothetical protein